MRFFQALLPALVLSALLPSFSQATIYQDDDQYIYQVVPWTEALLDEGTQTKVLHTSLNVFQNKLKDLVEQGILPSELVTIEDIEKLRTSEKDVSALIEKMNSWIMGAREKAPRLLQGTDALPDALLVYAGGKFSANLRVGGGASAMIGVVIMPVVVTQLDKLTQEVVATFVSAKIAAVGWPNVDLGVGVGGGKRARVGMGLIWNTNDTFTSPDQYVGLGFGLSGSAVLGPVGANFKAGILNNTSLPDWVDFVFASAAWEAGLAASAEPIRGNAFYVAPLENIIEALSAEDSDSIKREIEALERDLATDLESVTRITVEPSNEEPAVTPMN